jgi:hypothetical protein
MSSITAPSPTFCSIAGKISEPDILLWTPTCCDKSLSFHHKFAWQKLMSAALLQPRSTTATTLLDCSVPPSPTCACASTTAIPNLDAIWLPPTTIAVNQQCLSVATCTRTIFPQVDSKGPSPLGPNRSTKSTCPCNHSFSTFHHFPIFKYSMTLTQHSL